MKNYQWLYPTKVFVPLQLLFVACSVQTEKCTDVNQDKIYQGYSVSYDATSNTTSASAQFRFGGITGTTLEMDGKCSISHDSISLSKDALSGIIGTSYGGSKSGYVASNTFTFTNNNGQGLVNKIDNASAVELSSPPSSISKGSDVTLSFTPAVGMKESVSVYVKLTNPPDGSSTTSASGSTDAQGATSVTITSTKLSQLSSTGAITLDAERTYSKGLDQAAASESGHMVYYYHSPKVASTLTN